MLFNLNKAFKINLNIVTGTWINTYTDRLKNGTTKKE